jgi:Fe-S oxidoreductase
MSNVIKLNPEIREAIIESGGQDVIKCYQCGRCMAACPWNLLEKMDYTTYRFCQRIRLGAIIDSEEKEDIAADTNDVFRCVGCDSCQHECPRGVSLSDVLRAIRRILVDYDSYPGELKSVISRLYNTGNPLGESPEQRSAWADDVEVPRFDGTYEYLYFACCIPSYDNRAQAVAKATAKLLKKAHVSFGMIGEQEFCCGEAVRRVGAEKVFQTAMKNNIDAFTKHRVTKVLTTSPHCFLTFTKDYPEVCEDLTTVHATQLFYDLIRKKRLVPERPYNKTVVYHDPCTLGRQMGVYDEPRAILESIPGLKLVEVPVFNRESSVCCGAGAMGLWRDWPQEERLANLRVKQILATGAETLAVACPYCLQMFEETMKSMNADIEIVDIAEILWVSVGEGMQHET